MLLNEINALLSAAAGMAAAARQGGSRRKEREINPGVKMYSLNQFLEN